MKKVIVTLLLVFVVFSGCSVLNDIAPEEAVFSINDYHLQITADSTFQQKTGGNFDLQITNNKAYISIMAYKYTDLPSNVTPLDVYDTQNEDLLGKRTAVAVIEEAQTQTLSQHQITQALYSAEKDGVKNYYAAYLIDLPNEETFAWILVTAAPSYFDANRDYLHNIVCSLTTAKS